MATGSTSRRSTPTRTPPATRRSAFVGTNPVDQAGEIGVLVVGGVTYVVAETNGAAGADLIVQMVNSMIGAAADFIL